jgi:hypothetical protein
MPVFSITESVCCCYTSQAPAKSTDAATKGSKQQGISQEVEPLRVLSVAWLVIPVGAIVAAGVCSFVLRAAKQQEEQVHGYSQAVVLHGGCNCMVSKAGSVPSSPGDIHQEQPGKQLRALQERFERCALLSSLT